MEQSEIIKQVTEFIEQNFVYDQEMNLNKDESLLDSGLVDSTGILEVVSFLEQNYNVSVEDDEMVPDNLDSITKISNFINRKIN